MNAADGEAARLAARRAIEEVESEAPDILRIADVDLRPAAEHAIFTALRRAAREDGQLPGGEARSRIPTRLVPLARVATLLPRTRPSRGRTADSHGVVFVVNAPIHCVLAHQVVEALASSGDVPAHLVMTDRPPADGAGFATVARLGRRVDPAWLPPLAAHALSVARFGEVWPTVGPGRHADRARVVLGGALPRLALLAATLDTEVRRTRPAVIAAFNESGPWGRLVPAVAHARGLPAVDVPHAEAADPWGSMGIGYDRVLVYGARSAEVMRQAGVEPAHIVQVGGLRYDPLVRAVDRAMSIGQPRRRIIFASQPSGPGRAMKDQEKAATLRLAIAACQEAAPCEVVIRPHPTETDHVAIEVLDALVAPDGVSVRVDAEHDLHDLVSSAWLLMTASSQSVYEAAIVGIPSITIHLGAGTDPVPFAQEGIAIGCSDDASARAAVRSLTEDASRRVAVGRARAALAPHLGEVDGRAAERVAQEIRRLAVL